MNFKSTKDARKAGIAAIYQHIAAYPYLTVVENIFIGHMKKRYGIVQWKEMYAEADQLLQELIADFDSHAIMGNLSVAQQQMVEIAKALGSDFKLLILDEPTKGVDVGAGTEFTADNGNTYAVTAGDPAETQIIVGPPFAFTGENIADWANVY